MNNIINIFDNYFRNINITNIEENNMETFNFIFDLYTAPTVNNNFEDVKIVLNEDKFNNLERVSLNNLVDTNVKDCLICLECFDEKDELIKIKCKHIFHCNCIKSWLCNESNKCPVCRIEVDKGDLVNY